MKRQIVLDTETTGINFNGPPHHGHNIIEIGAIEIINRKITGNNFHVYLKPDRLIDDDAFQIHGISNQFLSTKPKFKSIARKFIDYIKGSELIIHNASFDISFINHELKLSSFKEKVEDICKILDTLVLAREKFPSKKHNLDALCSRFNIDISKRKKHSALLDAQLLAQVYLKMTSGQLTLDVYKSISLKKYNNFDNQKNKCIKQTPLLILYPSNEELLIHENYLKDIQQENNTEVLWNIK